MQRLTVSNWTRALPVAENCTTASKLCKHTPTCCANRRSINQYHKHRLRDYPRLALAQVLVIRRGRGTGQRQEDKESAGTESGLRSSVHTPPYWLIVAF